MNTICSLPASMSKLSTAGQWINFVFTSVFFTCILNNWQDSFRMFLTVFQFIGFLVSKCRCGSISVFATLVDWLVWFHLILYYFLKTLRRPNCSKDSSFSVVYKLASGMFCLSLSTLFLAGKCGGRKHRRDFYVKYYPLHSEDRQQVQVFWMTVFSKA